MICWKSFDDFSDVGGSQKNFIIFHVFEVSMVSIPRELEH
jgi:hypothetical protein